jgi:tRNA pseudouridine55 synthase
MARSTLSGVAVVDKPRGVTSHTVVAQARRLFARKDIGHAGTLDPMATGVLLVLVGQATKLSGYLTADSKRYCADIELGRATDTLDAEGETTEQSELDAARLSRDVIEQALDEERARTEQVPPAVSAIKVGGVRSYALARDGAPPELAARPVRVLELTLLELGLPRLRCDLLVSKGYYVRSFARDLGQRLGAPAHLCGLRRLASGPFGIERATPWPASEPPPLLPLADAARSVLPTCQLRADDGVLRARQGKPLQPDDFHELPLGEGVGAWLSPHGELVAIGTTQGELRVVRGFNSEA